MITTTTSTSIKVNPARRARMTLLRFRIPIADVGVDAFPARLPVRAEREKVVFAAMRAGVDVLVIVAPGVLARLLHVAARAPMADGRVRRLLHERAQPLVGGRVFGVVEP